MAEEGGDVPDPGVGGGGGGRCVGGSASVCRGGAATSAAALPSSSKTAETSTKKKATASSVARKNHAPWFAAEDQRLRTIVAEEQRQRKGEAIRWTRVAEAHGGSRTAKQLRERWVNVLDPSRKQGEWTEEETTLVIRLQKELGNRWSEISAQLPGRSSNDVKNKWHGSKKIRRAGDDTCSGIVPVGGEDESSAGGEVNSKLKAYKVQETSSTINTPFPTLSTADIDNLLIDNLKSALVDRNLDTSGDIHRMRNRLRVFIERQASSSVAAATSSASRSSSNTCRNISSASTQSLSTSLVAQARATLVGDSKATTMSQVLRMRKPGSEHDSSTINACADFIRKKLMPKNCVNTNNCLSTRCTCMKSLGPGLVGPVATFAATTWYNMSSEKKVEHIVRLVKQMQVNKEDWSLPFRVADIIQADKSSSQIRICRNAMCEVLGITTSLWNEILDASLHELGDPVGVPSNSSVARTGSLSERRITEKKTKSISRRELGVSLRSKIPPPSTITKKPAAGKSGAVPPADDHEVLQPTPRSDWRETIDDSSGKPYYYHVVTNEVTWDKPACLAALDDLPPSTESTMRARGIGWHKKHGKWQAQIKVAGKSKHIGYFDSLEEASAAYEIVRKALDECGLPTLDDGRLAVYEAAKSKAIGAATLKKTAADAAEAAILALGRTISDKRNESIPTSKSQSSSAPKPSARKDPRPRCIVEGCDKHRQHKCDKMCITHYTEGLQNCRGDEDSGESGDAWTCQRCNNENDAEKKRCACYGWRGGTMAGIRAPVPKRAKTTAASSSAYGSDEVKGSEQFLKRAAARVAISKISAGGQNESDDEDGEEVEMTDEKAERLVPDIAVGTNILKYFAEGKQYYQGKITRLPGRGNGFYHVRYDDGDDEDMAPNEMWMAFSDWCVANDEISLTQFEPNQQVYAVDCLGVPREAEIKSFRPVEKQGSDEWSWSYLVHYDGWSSRHDEWVDADEIERRLPGADKGRKSKDQPGTPSRKRKIDPDLFVSPNKRQRWCCHRCDTVNGPDGTKCSHCNGDKDDEVEDGSEAEDDDEPETEATEAVPTICAPRKNECAIEGCGKWVQSNCNGMCIGHHRESLEREASTDDSSDSESNAGDADDEENKGSNGNHLCFVEGCDKYRQSGPGGMCCSHYREAQNKPGSIEAKTGGKECEGGEDEDKIGFGMGVENDKDVFARAEEKQCIVVGCTRWRFGWLDICKHHCEVQRAREPTNDGGTSSKALGTANSNISVRSDQNVTAPSPNGNSTQIPDEKRSDETMGGVVIKESSGEEDQGSGIEAIVPNGAAVEGVTTTSNVANVSVSTTMTNEGSDEPVRVLTPSIGREGASLQAVMALLKDSDDEGEDDDDLFG